MARLAVITSEEVYTTVYIRQWLSRRERQFPPIRGHRASPGRPASPDHRDRRGAFLHGGFDGTSMDDVARAAGISRLVVYRIFDTKEHLYRAVLSSVTDEFVAEFENLDLAEIRRRGGMSASCWASPDVIPMPFGCCGARPPTNRPSPPSPTLSAKFSPSTPPT